MQIFTSSWFSPLPDSVQKIGISRAVPRGYPAGYRRLRDLEPGEWFRSVTPREYHRRYMQQLAQLDAAVILALIQSVAAGRDAALLCYESPRDPEQWCHRGQVSAWFQDTLSLDIFEYGEEACGCGWRHPKLYTAFRKGRSRP